MTGMTMRRGLALLGGALALALGALPAGAQSRNYWVSEWNSNQASLKRAQSYQESLRGQLDTVSDNAIGCRLLRNLSGSLWETTKLAARMATIAQALGDRDGYRAARDLEAAASRDRDKIRYGTLAECIKLGL